MGSLLALKCILNQHDACTGEVPVTNNETIKIFYLECSCECHP